ncbi:hypothetical protein GGH98_005282 [Coemansia sp. RSA 454]|nr:hypothetical protein GGH98_005282 [Coemansia sp. RSA 454]
MENTELQNQFKTAAEQVEEQPKKLTQEEQLKLQDQFETAAKQVQELPKKPTNDEKLKLYGLYKQANSGDVDTEKPGMFEFEKKAKWDAWNNIKGKPENDAKTEYIALVKELQAKYAE